MNFMGHRIMSKRNFRVGTCQKGVLMGINDVSARVAADGVVVTFYIDDRSFQPLCKFAETMNSLVTVSLLLA